MYPKLLDLSQSCWASVLHLRAPFALILVQIFGLDVDDCYMECWGLVLTFRRICNEGNTPERVFRLGTTSSPLGDSTAIKQYIEDMITRHGLSAQTPWTDLRFNRTRV
jgi:hypothetical protein